MQSKARHRLGLRGSQHLDTSHRLSTSSRTQDLSSLHPTSPDVKYWQQQRYPNGSAFMSIGLLFLILGINPDSVRMGIHYGTRGQLCRQNIGRMQIAMLKATASVLICYSPFVVEQHGNRFHHIFSKVKGP